MRVPYFERLANCSENFVYFVRAQERVGIEHAQVQVELDGRLRCNTVNYVEHVLFVVLVVQVLHEIFQMNYEQLLEQRPNLQ
jgi:hypothetical protein